MSIPPNIDRFNKATLLVLDKLYQAFPVPIELSASKVAMDTLPQDATYDESFQTLEPIYWTIVFLRNEGFIEYGQSTQDGTTFFQAKLTTKSLALLGQIPSALEPQISVSDTVRGVVKGGIKEASAEVVKKVVESIITNTPSLVSFGQSIASSMQ